MDDVLKARLSEMGMTAADLARSLGVSLSTVYHWPTTPLYVQAYIRQRLLVLEKGNGESGMAVSAVQGGVGADGDVMPLSDQPGVV